MSVSSDDLLNAASSICGAASDEAYWRGGVSRAYYAAHHQAYKFHSVLPSPGSVGNSSGRHSQLISQLKNPTIKLTHALYVESRAIGDMLSRIEKLRVLSDYNLGGHLDCGDMQTALADTQELFARTRPHVP